MDTRTAKVVKVVKVVKAATVAAPLPAAADRLPV
jgi:hypothetical protein